MAQKILYFTAGPTPTTQEQGEIDQLNELAKAPYTIGVRNAVEPALYQPKPEETDFVSGAVPDEFSEIPVFDPDNPPDPDPLPSNQAIVTDGDILNVDGGTVTLSVSENVVTAEFTPE